MNRNLKFVLLVFVLSRVLVALAALVGQMILPMPQAEGFYRIHPEIPMLDAAARWDSGFYLEIASIGYHFSLGEISNVAFFPLYPLLIAFLTPLVGDAVVAGVWLSHLCFLLALFFLEALTRRELGVVAARAAVIGFCCFPTSFFFSAVYTESLFVLTVLACFYFVKQKNLPLASFAALLASSTRFIGLVLCLVLWLEFRRGSANWLWLAAPILGPLSYAGFLLRLFDDPIAFWTVQPNFGRQGFNPLEALRRDLEPLTRGEIPWNVILDLGALSLVLVLLPQLWRLRQSYAVYSALSVMIPLLSGTGSLSRYVLAIFPIMLFTQKVPWWVLVLSTGLLVFLTMKFAVWTFVA